MVSSHTRARMYVNTSHCMFSLHIGKITECAVSIIGHVRTDRNSALKLNFYLRIACLIGCLQARSKEATIHALTRTDETFDCKAKHESNYYRRILLKLVYYRNRMYIRWGFIYTRILQIIIPRDTRVRECWIGRGSLPNEKREIHVDDEDGDEDDDDDDAQDICGSETSNKLCAVLSSVESVSNNKPSTQAKFSHYPLT